ncbi:malto-oligosyltrehalose synthase [Virgisporangium ochraceum]|uniref:Malto-oligosyltrehalose synthase n=1 Tax=Virgisporangium ochraceum TaxID=65505 RepID=A0A8J4A6M9_9ACTN|nr:malto-oligosyltrehalose synthase [Virgisporangium ochraceum]GIJ75173.1 malto-oligosyltrehalose synthase [Virgisporangium ochraceum]
MINSTYRVQVRPGFGLAATAGLAGYLADLGVTHLYTSPLLAATPGSEHGYDVVDHTRVNPELGGEEQRQALGDALREHGLGLVVDIVPNHAGVAVPHANPAWWDVLKNGRDSAYAHWFDIDWERGRILLPVLGSDDDVDKLRVEDGELRYYDHRFPLAEGTDRHDDQHYELVDWRRGNTEINYRRFFAIAELAGLRVEDPDVFQQTHAEILRWYKAGDVDGIRVDHPDGLRDPAGYLQRLRDHAPDAWLVIEKILEPGEPLPEWPVDGTTGYDALAEACGVFVDTSAADAFTMLDARLLGAPTAWIDLVHTGKIEAATRLLSSELSRLSSLAGNRDGTGDALAEVAAAFPVYRSYLPAAGGGHLAEALAAAKVRRPDLTEEIDRLAPRLAAGVDDLAVRFQQFTGAVMAKGVEDTAFYRWSRFVALNEVGGDPSRFGVTPEAFHAASASRQADWPRSMTTLSTHDTKRGEDVRARLAVLSELPDEWGAAVDRWSAAAPVPDPATAHLLWQTVAGAWPIERERLHAYMEKATREASTHTSWASPDEEFEAAVRAAVDRAYDDPRLRADIDGFVAGITPGGWSNALGQKLVQLLMPGIPDVYQGTELWDNSLVDPDNRRDVDFALRRDLLTRIGGGWRPPVDDSGAAKLLLVTTALKARRGRDLTDYTALTADGPAADHCLAFDRGGLVVVATRLPLGLAKRGGWGDTTVNLPEGVWKDSLTGVAVTGRSPLIRDLLGAYPVALLAMDEA